MSSLTLENVRKTYGKKVALKGIDLTVADAEFFVILGPSGAGKTTTLKSVAGLQEIDDGTVSIGDVDMDGVEPYLRNVAMAFESYALYPQDTVFENLASPLRSGRLGKFSQSDQEKRIELVTTTLGINHLLQRFPRELSNGQRQRVALGRVLVRPAGIYLLDEPLSHLDAKLRAAMRAELKNLGSMSQTTTLYVTHDYQEALALGDKIAVLREGAVVQVGTPLEVWRDPVDAFVARALGQPERTSSGQLCRTGSSWVPAERCGCRFRRISRSARATRSCWGCARARSRSVVATGLPTTTGCRSRATCTSPSGWVARWSSRSASATPRSSPSSAVTMRRPRATGCDCSSPATSSSCSPRRTAWSTRTPR